MKKLWGLFFSWNPKPRTGRDFHDGDVIVALSFGKRQDGPGLSNEALAKSVDSLRKELSLPVIAQVEISDAMLRKPDFVISKHRISDEYLDTREILLQVAKICEEKDWKSVVIVAHPYHMWRIVNGAARLDLSAYITKTREVPYDTESTQFWTRGKMRLIPREILVRIRSLIRGWV